MGNKKLIILTGAIIGSLALTLVKLGNPANMGVCIACFLRDVSGSLGLHQAKLVQYMRPEILGIVLGAFLTARATGDFRATGGSSPLIRFILGLTMMIGMLVFLGCPLRVALRLGAGDLNALVGLAGLIAGVVAGTLLIRKGFSLGRAGSQPKANGYVFPLMVLVLLILLLTSPSLFVFSQEGPGSMHAPLFISLSAGIVIGALSQRSRLCLAGGVRDMVLFKNFHLISGFAVIFVVVLVGNLLTGGFKPGFAEQPIAHTEALWNFLGMALAGFSAALLGGCPLRQLVLASEGNSDSAVTVLGMLFGAALAHNFGIAASPKGVPANGQIAVLIGLALTAAIGYLFRKWETKGSLSVKSSVKMLE